MLSSSSKTPAAASPSAEKQTSRTQRHFQVKSPQGTKCVSLLYLSPFFPKSVYCFLLNQDYIQLGSIASFLLPPFLPPSLPPSLPPTPPSLPPLSVIEILWYLSICFRILPISYEILRLLPSSLGPACSGFALSRGFVISSLSYFACDQC